MKVQRSNKYKFVYFIICLVFLIAFDIYFSGYLSNISSIIPINFVPGVKLHYMENTGAAFSLFQNSITFLIVFAITAIVLILWYLIKHLRVLTMVELFFVSMLTSGIFCNLYERIILGYVRDYFAIKFINFPIFNVSDVFINISVVVIMYLLVTKTYNKK